MRQQEFNRSVGQVIQADSVIQEFGSSERGRALTLHERRELNQEVRKVAAALSQSGGLVWKTLHRAVGVSSVEEMRIADLSAVQTILGLLREQGALIEALVAAQRSEKAAVAALPELRAEIEALKRENAEMGARLESTYHDAGAMRDVAVMGRSAVVDERKSLALGLLLGGCFALAATAAFF